MSLNLTNPVGYAEQVGSLAGQRWWLDSIKIACASISPKHPKTASRAAWLG